MDNIHEVGVKPYNAAAEEQTPFSTSEKLNFLVILARKVIKYLLLSGWLYVQAAWEFVVPREPKSIRGQIAVVTGGANGLGRALCHRLAKEGCSVAVVDVDDANIKRTVTDLRQQYKIEAKGYRVDVSDYAAVLEMKKQIDTDLGTVDILVNNAGLLPKVSLMEGDASDISKIIDVNLKAQFWTIRAFLGDMMKRRKGHICAISSLCGIEAQARMVTYSSSKFGVTGLMDGLHDELSVNGLDDAIFTTCCHPYFISTRQELIDAINESPFYSRVPIMTPTYTANTIVDGLLRNQKKVYIPGIVKAMLFFHLNQPFRVRKLFRRIFYEEP